MPENFDAENAAKEAIATSPEPTEGVELGASEESAPESEAQGEIAEYIPDRRNAKLLTITLKQWDKNGRLDPAQLDAVEEVGAEGFGAINASPVPHTIKLGITIALLLASIIPLILEITGTMKGGGDA